MDIIYTAAQLKEIYTRNGRKFYTINNKDISWYKSTMKSMFNAQIEINNLILTKSLGENDLKTLKMALRELTNDMDNCNTSVCYVCGDVQNSRIDMYGGEEHITINKCWGFNSLYDADHKLVLCCDCYDKHVMKGELGKYVKISCNDM
jgi:hypothetical protein